MGVASTVLTSIKEGDLWRVEIVWPNGTKRYFGKFGSEQEAERWISTHRCLTERGIGVRGRRLLTERRSN
jgi:hypothetical protein